jgi:ATP-dependent DNA helicase Q4
MQGAPASGLALARILHGLHSPAFPRDQWGRCGFWGRYADVDFGQVLEVAEAEAAAAQ